MQEEVRWTNLTQEQIAQGLAEAGSPVSVPVVKQLLDRHGFVRRKAQKSTAMGHHAEQDAPFKNIARFKDEFFDSNDPVLSMDSKKKELIGPFFRSGTLSSEEVVEVFDHDFPSFADGRGDPPRGVRRGAQRGPRHAGHQPRHQRVRLRQRPALVGPTRAGPRTPSAERILMLCDGGGSNSASCHLFKDELQRLADELGIEIRVAHYPPYCSKYNPIEHRLFPHVTRACAGVVFESVELVRRLVAGRRRRRGCRCSLRSRRSCIRPSGRSPRDSRRR